MKSSKMILLTLPILFLAFCISGLAVAAKKTGVTPPANALVFDVTHTIDANMLQMFVTNIGNFAYDKTALYGRNSGLYYPRGTTKTVMYDAGVWLGAKVNGQIRIALAEYSSEFVPGTMANGTFQPDNATFRVFKIKRGDNTSNPDYVNWPITMGAPVDEQGKPLSIGDQTTWSVYNDANPTNHVNNAGATPPLGVEIQQTTFAYARQGSLGTIIFMKFKIINKGLNHLDSTFISIWADPDVGDANSDLVGCDTLKSLGFCYNAGPDAIYGEIPPAVGFDFLQGPVVPGAPADSAFMTGEWRKGFRNLPMTSFNRYINGIDPANSLETYRYMNGLNRDGTAMTNALTNQITKFACPGDPVSMTGWIDNAPADRRLMLSSGPFNMSPGDTQEVVVAVIVGQGNDPISSVGSLKSIDISAQTLYDHNFDVGYPPSAINPSVYLRSGNGTVDITWGSEPLDYFDYIPGLDQSIKFEGFDLYQGESANGPWHKFATYDLDDSVALIYNDIYDPIGGGIERVIVQSGTNSGLRFDRLLTQSYLDDVPFVTGQTYYFGVTAYFYDHNHLTEFRDLNGNLLGYLTTTIESPIVAHQITAAANPGLLSDTALHIAGSSDGKVVVEYLDLEQVTGHNYEVTFAGNGLWYLYDITAGVYNLTAMEHHTDDFNFPVVDGIMVRVIGSKPGIKDWQWSGGTRWMTGADFSGRFFFGGLFAGPDFFGSNIDTLHDYVDVEVRFSKINTQKAYDYLRGGSPSYGYIGYFNCPFTVWDVTSNPARQLNALFVENKSGPTYDSTWFPGSDGVISREYLMILKSSYSPTPLSSYTSKLPNADAPDMDILYALTPEIRAGHDPNLEFQEGQKFTILSSKPNTSGDIFQFRAGPQCGDIDISGAVNLSDIVYLINYIFGGGATPLFGKAADVTCDEKINLTDAVFMVNYIFAGGPTPCANCARL